MVSLFKQFNAVKNSFSNVSKRCKIIDFSKLESARHWLVDRWWTTEEKIDLQIHDEHVEVDEAEFYQMAAEARDQIQEFLNTYNEKL